MSFAAPTLGPRVWVDSSVLDIDHRIKHGDESGWRGDPSMFLMYNPESKRFEVWGIDRGGNQYMAASHHACDITLLHKLVAGDPQKNDVFAQVLEQNRKIKAEQEATERDKRLEVADKIGFAVRQDIGHLFGGRRPTQSMYSRANETKGDDE
jgi:hypothetical protein